LVDVGGCEKTIVLAVEKKNKELNLLEGGGKANGRKLFVKGWAQYPR